MYVSVQFKRSGDVYGGGRFIYKTELPLVPTDKVICPTQRGSVPAMVVEVDVPESRIDARYLDDLKEITEYQPAPAEDAT